MHTTPQNSLDAGPLRVVREGQTNLLEIIVYQGQRVKIDVGATRAALEPPKGGIIVEILRDARVVSAIHLDQWTRHTTRVMQHGPPESLEGVLYASDAKALDFDPGGPGAYTLDARLKGCDAERRNFVSPVRLEVRSVSTPRDRAQVLQYLANKAAFDDNDCAAALRSAAQAEALAPDADAPLVVQAFCAEKTGDLKTAVRLLERLQARVEAKGVLGPGYSQDLSRLREKARAAEIPQQMPTHGSERK